MLRVTDCIYYVLDLFLRRSQIQRKTTSMQVMIYLFSPKHRACKVHIRALNYKEIGRYGTLIGSWAEQDYIVKMTSMTPTRPIKSFLTSSRTFPRSHLAHHLPKRQDYRPQSWDVLELPNPDQKHLKMSKTMDLF